MSESYFQILIAWLLNWSLSNPKPGIFAVQPQPDVLKSIISTSKTSPGKASSTNKGPVTGFTFDKSNFDTSLNVDSWFSWPPEESIVLISIISLSLMRSIGLLLLSHPKWLWIDT